MEYENPQLISDLFFMLNASQDLEKNISQAKINASVGNEKNKLLEKINLESEIKKLKSSLSSFEENYGYISPYHDDILTTKKDKKISKILTKEISNKIYELHEKKYYNDCYDLWSLYDMKPLYDISGEENFEILRHLTKVKDAYLKRKKIINNLEKFNYFDDNNYTFETGINFENNKNDIIKDNKKRKDINIINQNNESFRTHNYHENIN